MGSFGAIAEIHHVDGDPPTEATDAFARVTSRGGVAFTNLSNCQPVAKETLSPRPERWGQGVALCLPSGVATMARRSVLAALGSDPVGLRLEDRDAWLFDMGLDQPKEDVCIRTVDPQLIEVLTAAEGKSLYEPGTANLAARPHRVALTRNGRVEVFQKIGGPDTGGKSPVGPHIHILPKLIATGRTHSANTPIPEGLVPVAGLHPASALSGSLGHNKPWDQDAFTALQSLFQSYAPAEQAKLKTLVRGLIAANSAPEDFPPPTGWHMRAVVRIALGQAAREHGETPLPKHGARRSTRRGGGGIETFKAQDFRCFVAVRGVDNPYENAIFLKKSRCGIALRRQVPKSLSQCRGCAKQSNGWPRQIF